MAENHKKTLLTVKQKHKINEHFENGESATISQKLWSGD
jgi:hypothetical protein